MAIESKNLLVWVKAMSRGQALPLDASEIYTSMEDAEAYASSPIAYAGQTIKVLQDDGKYHEYILQPGSSGYVLEEVISGSSDNEDIDLSLYATVEQLNNKADAKHTHSWENLTDKPTIPTIPDSLPADGGNADTVDGKHADDFALSEHDHDGVYVPVDTFNDLVGNTKVEDQIKNQLKDIQIEKEIYIQNDEPADAADGTVWIDIDANSSSTSGSASVPTVTEQDNGRILMVVEGRWSAVQMPYGEGVEF